MYKNSLKDIKLDTGRLDGIYRGIIEDNTDPLKAGRCKIRVWGIHTAKKGQSTFEGIPTEHLPWAEPAYGLLGGSISGIGVFTVPVQGSHVYLFFENSDILSPRYFATAPGIPTTAPNKNLGFNDPDGVYPRSDRLNEPDTHRLSRGITTQTIIEYKNSNVKKSVYTAFGGSWSEPESTYAAVYPNNTTVVTPGGITLELDSTPGKKRFHLFHPSNTYVEIDNDGNVVIRNNKTKYEIILEDHNIYIKANRNVSVDGDTKNYTKGNKDEEVGGNLKVVATRIDLN